jgi:hypothetical protein
MLSRRKFLASTSGTLVSVGFPLSALATTSRDGAKPSAISPGLNAECSVFRDGQCVAQLTLTGLGKPFSSDARTEQFTLKFEASNPLNLPEATYAVFHPTLGQLDLFLQPCGAFVRGQHDGMNYQSCFAMLR